MSEQDTSAVDATAKVKLTKATVRQGSVVWGDGQTALPGEEVRLPADEVAALRARGVLVDPGAAPIYAAGPVSDIDKVGPTVTEA